MKNSQIKSSINFFTSKQLDTEMILKIKGGDETSSVEESEIIITEEILVI